MPESPWMQVHAGFGKKRGCIQIVRELLDQVTHGIAIVFGRQAVVSIGIGWETDCHRRNVSFLVRRSVDSEFAGFLDRLVRSLEAFGIGGIVVIGADGFSDAPISHGHLWIELGSLFKGAGGLFMIERID